MNHKIKAVVAAVALVVTGAANAQILTDKITQTGDGEVFLSFLNNTVSPSSLLVDTGINTSALTANPNAFEGYSIGNMAGANVFTTGLSSFFTGKNSADVVFNAGGNQVNINNPNQFGVLLSGPSTPTTGPTNFSDVNTAQTKITSFIDSANPALGSSTTLVAFPPVGSGVSPGWHGDTQTWASNDGGAVSFNTEGSVNSPLAFKRYFLLTATTGTNSLLGFWNVDFAKGLATFNVSPVPLPAAVWLLGSALIGLVGVSRRKRNDDDAGMLAA